MSLENNYIDSMVWWWYGVMVKWCDGEMDPKCLNGDMVKLRNGEMVISCDSIRYIFYFLI